MLVVGMDGPGSMEWLGSVVVWEEGAVLEGGSVGATEHKAVDDATSFGAIRA